MNTVCYALFLLRQSPVVLLYPHQNTTVVGKHYLIM